jgi:hypothetical protein
MRHLRYRLIRQTRLGIPIALALLLGQANGSISPVPANGWMSSSPGLSSQTGAVLATDERWSEDHGAATTSCDARAHLCCFEVR